MAGFVTEDVLHLCRDVGHAARETLGKSFVCNDTTLMETNPDLLPAAEFRNSIKLQLAMSLCSTIAFGCLVTASTGSCVTIACARAVAYSSC